MRAVVDAHREQVAPAAVQSSCSGALACARLLRRDGPSRDVAAPRRGDYDGAARGPG
jgi:hypothetical protein